MRGTQKTQKLSSRTIYRVCSTFALLASALVFALKFAACFLSSENEPESTMWVQHNIWNNCTVRMNFCLFQLFSFLSVMKSRWNASSFYSPWPIQIKRSQFVSFGENHLGRLRPQQPSEIFVNILNKVEKRMKMKRRELCFTAFHFWDTPSARNIFHLNQFETALTWNKHSHKLLSHSPNDRSCCFAKTKHFDAFCPHILHAVMSFYSRVKSSLKFWKIHKHFQLFEYF